MNRLAPVIVLLLAFSLLSAASAAETPSLAPSSPHVVQSPLEDVIPLTVGNLRGHRMLYNEGWYVVTSSKRAFSYAKEHSFASSASALKRAAREAAHDTSDYSRSVGSDVRDAAKDGKTLVTGGTNLTGQILAATQDVAKAELNYADERFQKAMDAFVKGNLSIARRTQQEREELARLPGNYFRTIKDDFSNLYELAARARKRFSGRIDPAWEASFQKASREFRSEYERSGTEQNTLMALGPILYGYLKSFYYGLAAPASKTIVKTTAAGANYTVFLPVTATSIVAGRTVQAVGLTLVASGKTGLRIISPTVEAGLLSGMSLLSLGTVPVTYAAGGGLGAINQVAFSTVGPAAATVEGAGAATVHTAGYVGFLAYDAAKGTTEVVINQAASGIALGYNALTAIPTHAAMGLVDTAVFLAWDGPRLVIASAQGRVSSGSRPGQSYSIGDLPVGSVVDLNKLRNTEGVKVEVLSTDNTVIRDVLQKIPDDVRADQ